MARMSTTHMSDLPDQTERLKRGSAPELDQVLGTRFRVLDDGFVRVVDYMGSDEAIVQAARVSYGEGTKKIHEDRGLIRYLMRHRHSTPYEMCEIKFHCKLPIFVARQWIRHRTACIAGATKLSFDLPGAGRRGRRSHRARTIESLHAMWTEGTRIVIDRKKKPTFLDRIDPKAHLEHPSRPFAAPLGILCGPAEAPP